MTDIMSPLSALAQSGLREYCETLGLGELYQGARYDLGLCAHLWFLLRRSPDTEATFPRGKWATIHLLEKALEQVADTELRRSNNAIREGLGL